jgi:hypothetical protein
MPSWQFSRSLYKSIGFVWNVDPAIVLCLSEWIFLMVEDGASTHFGHRRNYRSTRRADKRSAIRRRRVRHASTSPRGDLPALTLAYRQRLSAIRLASARRYGQLARLRARTKSPPATSPHPAGFGGWRSAYPPCTGRQVSDPLIRVIRVIRGYTFLRPHRPHQIGLAQAGHFVFLLCSWQFHLHPPRPSGWCSLSTRCARPSPRAAPAGC